VPYPICGFHIHATFASTGGLLLKVFLSLHPDVKAFHGSRTKQRLVGIFTLTPEADHESEIFSVCVSVRNSAVFFGPKAIESGSVSSKSLPASSTLISVPGM